MGSTQFQSRLLASQETITLKVVDLKKTKNKTAGALYMGGQLARGSHASAAIANLRTMLCHHFSNFEKSDVWQKLLSLDRLLASDGGRSWLRSYQVGNPALAQLLLGQAQCILSAYSALAGHDEFRKAVKTGAAISPKAFKAVGNYADSVLATLSRDIAEHNAKNWWESPRYILFLKEFKETPSPTPVKEPETKKAKLDTRAPPAASTPGSASGSAHPGSDSQPSAAQIKERKTKGFLTWSKPGIPRPCPVLWTVPEKGGAKRFCTNFATHGLACKFNKCNNHHVTGFQTIPVAQQPEFTTWLNGVDGLDYVTGRAPPGM